jgi:thioredoxin-related protein
MFSINALYGISWEKSIDTGLKKAQENKKCVFLLFTGSDWCKYCITLEKHVLSKSVFKDYAEENLILVKYDKRKKTSKSKQKKIKEVMEKYSARGYPTIFVLDPDNNKLGHMGSSEDPDGFVTQLKQIVSTYKPPEDKEDAADAIPDTSVASPEAKPTPADYPYRTWTNNKGKKITGKLIRFDEDRAVIMNRKGRKSTVSRKILSDEDNAYLDEINQDS